MLRFSFLKMSIVLLCASVSRTGRTDTLAHWRFEEGAGYIAYDSSENNNDAVFVNPLAAQPWSSAVPSDVVLPGGLNNDGSLHLNGFNEVALAYDTQSLRPTTGITVEAFVRLDTDITGAAGIVSRPKTGNGNSFQLGLRGASNFAFFGVNDQAIDLGTALDVNRWYHLAGTWDGSDARIYIDGLLLGQTSMGGPISYPTSQPVVIGADIESDGQLHWFFPGNIDEVRISDVALDPCDFLQQNLIVNGSFEQNSPSAQNVPAGSNVLPGWEVIGHSVDLADGQTWPASDALRSVDLSGAFSGGVKQTFSTVAGEQYLVRFDLSGNPDPAQPDDDPIKWLKLTVDGQQEFFSFDSNNASFADMGWQSMEWVFTADDLQATLRLESANTSAWGPVIDNVVVTRYCGVENLRVVPELSTSSLILIVAAASVPLSVFRRKRAC